MVGLRSAFLLLVLMIFVSWVEGDSEILLSCSDLGGNCVSKENNTCSIQVESSGCDKHEICCKFQRYNEIMGGVRPGPIVCTETTPLTQCMKQDYDGVCQSKCNMRRVQVENCAGGCKCCGCQPKCSCLMRHGFCTENPGSCVGSTRGDWCLGGKCTCCVPDCPATPQCLSAGGRCAKSCGNDEEPHPSIQCIKENHDACLCCVPKKETCPNTKWCQMFGGRCQEYCHYKSQIVHRHMKLCGFGGCTCCFTFHG